MGQDEHVYSEAVLFQEGFGEAIFKGECGGMSYSTSFTKITVKFSEGLKFAIS